MSNKKKKRIINTGQSVRCFISVPLLEFDMNKTALLHDAE